MSVTVRVLLGGGLGNQLFMYAAGRALSLRIGAQLILDTSQFRFDETYKRVYLLDRFPIVAKTISEGPALRARSTAERVLRKFPRVACRLGLWDEPIHNGSAVFDQRLVTAAQGRSVSLRGNWQNERYFRDQSDRIRAELFPPQPRDPVANEELAKIRGSSHPVAVGIRFYREVPGESSDPDLIIAAFRKHLTRTCPRTNQADFFVFTEEPSYFSDPHCLGVPFTVVTHRPRNEDAPVNLHLMAHCRTFLIGYSSYHWWGAWLASVTGKRVTYLRFPGRPDLDYSAEGWDVASGE
jgi:hypothetical protein